MVYPGFSHQRHPLIPAQLPEDPAAAGHLIVLLVAVLPQASPLAELCQRWRWENGQQSYYDSRSWILVLSPAQQRPDCPISPSIPSLSGPWLALGAHSPLVDSSQAGDEQSCPWGEPGGGHSRVQGIQQPSGAHGDVWDTGLDCGQERRLLPACQPPSLQSRALDLYCSFEAKRAAISSGTSQAPATLP